MNEDILGTIIGGISLRDMSGIQFYTWILKKIDGLQSKSPALSELAMLATGAVGKHLPDDAKLAIIKKLQSLEISI